jgi:hypothetical protein
MYVEKSHHYGRTIGRIENFRERRHFSIIRFSKMLIIRPRNERLHCSCREEIEPYFRKFLNGTYLL